MLYTTYNTAHNIMFTVFNMKYKILHSMQYTVSWAQLDT